MRPHLIITIISTLFISSCGESKEISTSKLQDRNGVFFEVGSQTPFTGVAIQYFTNKQVHHKTQYKDGKRDGYFERWYSNGMQEYALYYKGGEFNGNYKQWYKNGALAIEAEFVAGKIITEKVWSKEALLLSDLVALDENGDKLNHPYKELKCVLDIKNNMVWDVSHLHGDYSKAESHLLIQNKNKTCGWNDWRIPTTREFFDGQGIPNSTTHKEFSSNFFGDKGEYWTSTPSKKYSDTHAGHSSQYKEYSENIDKKTYSNYIMYARSTSN
ncbi:DUF1566 domain-containing protein [Colwellia sp. 1_MG-2023]|uniref:Lcl domain-containing protein n=1 Tax=Colwellia sp. 1_MG-2023 TaxID=3062649 RepID=UPI0026E478D9|nr:DUF1566 domain-containing protein [Colwellia sp. 1_MG-2023]MDO6445330.1 DUF1566 domain-containing protein [Colwellia sp. 1_MG-2023]